MHKSKIALSLATIATLTAGCGSGDKPALDSTTNDTSCSVKEDDDGTVTIECPDGSSVTVNQGGDGENGNNGQDGENGKSGKTGAEGKDGTDGENGNNGQDGENGQDGTDGKNGNNGQDGENGQDGANGENGDNGQDGEKGDTGSTGAPGEKGQDGQTGLPGDAGASCSVECVDKQTARIFCQDGNEVRYQVDSCKMPPAQLLSARGINGCRILRGNRRLACWGSDVEWALGNGAYDDTQESGNLVDTRQLEDGLDTRWRSVDSTRFATCGITVAGAAYCWSKRQDTLGNGQIPSFVPSPVDISRLPPGTTWSVISLGNTTNFSCGLTSQGAAYCWGNDSSGRLGNGVISGTQSSPSPVDISGLPPGTTWTELGAGNGHVCALTSEGAAYCWGSDSEGKLGNGALADDQVSPSAVDLSALPPETTWATISVGREHVCALTAEGEAYCWGSDATEQLGNGALGAAMSPSPVDVTTLPDGLTFTQLSASEQHTCGLASDGSAWCWGDRTSGRLGDGTSEGSSPSPVAVDVSLLAPGTTWKSLSAGIESTCGLTMNETVYCWGSDSSAQLGNGAALSEPQLRPEHPLELSIGVLRGYPSFSGALEANNAHKDLVVLPLNGSTEELTVTAISSDEGIIPSANITVLGTGRERSLALEPIASGLVTITVAVASSADETSFKFEYGASAVPADPAGVYHHHISDASTALDVGDGYMLLGSDTTNAVSLHHQDAPGLPLKTWDFSGKLGGTTIRGIESAARSGNTIVWATSYANRLTNGAVEARRRTMFATTIIGTGADVELSFTGRYGGGAGTPTAEGLRGLWLDLITWDQANGHAMGANALGFAAATASGVVPVAPSGFNIEGLEFAADGTTGYLGFRAPTVDVSGTRHALIVPVTNILDLVAGIHEESGLGQFGAPILLDLDGRSIRDMRRNASGEYVIVASPPEGAAVGVNDTWALYTWAGDGQPAMFNRELPGPNSTTGGDWESIVSAPNPLGSGGSVRLVTDSGNTIFYGTGATSALELGLQKSYSQVFSLN